MGLLRPHRSVAPAPRATTDARGHARHRPAFCDFLIFRELQNEERRFYGKMQKRVDS